MLKEIQTKNSTFFRNYIKWPSLNFLGISPAKILKKFIKKILCVKKKIFAYTPKTVDFFKHIYQGTHGFCWKFVKKRRPKIMYDHWKYFENKLNKIFETNFPKKLRNVCYVRFISFLVRGSSTYFFKIHSKIISELLLLGSLNYS